MLKFTVLGEGSFNPGCRYRTLTLPTELVTDSMEAVQPHEFSIMRMAHSRRYIMSDFKKEVSNIMTMQKVREYCRATNIKYPGIENMHEVWYVELWHDEGDDGHVDYVHWTTLAVIIDCEMSKFYAADGTRVQRELHRAWYEWSEKKIEEEHFVDVDRDGNDCDDYSDET